MPPLPLTAQPKQAASVQRTLCALEVLFGSAKLEFHNLRGLFRRRRELPFLDRVLARLNEQGMPAHDSCGLDVSIRANHDLDFDFARDIHSAGEFRVHWRNLALDLALRFIGASRLRAHGNTAQKKQAACDKDELFPLAESHQTRPL